MDTLEEEHAATRAPRRRAAVRAEDIDDEPEMYVEERGRRGVRLRLRAGLMPQSRWGRIVAACALAMVLGAAVVTFVMVRRFLLHDERFVIASSESIEIQGNRHLNRAQLLSVFGGDVERNIFNVSLSERRAQLERLPWVQHATVMRLLPNRLRVGIVERVPVAFVREGGKIGMVDASGVLLDMSPQEMGSTRYSFPVVTGITAEDPTSTRSARMKIYAAFMKDIDSSGEKISEKLSEVDLSNPEDVKALIPEGTNDVLVHFGDQDYLERYRKFEEHLPEWRMQYPKLASVDMRYDRQVVLEMQAGASTAAGGDAASSDRTSSVGTDAGAVSAAAAADAKPVAQPATTAKVAPVAVLAAKAPAGVKTAPAVKASAAVKANARAKAAGRRSMSARTKAMLSRGRVLKAQQQRAAGTGGESFKSAAGVSKPAAKVSMQRSTGIE